MFDEALDPWIECIDFHIILNYLMRIHEYLKSNLSKADQIIQLRHTVNSHLMKGFIYIENYMTFFFLILNKFPIGTSIKCSTYTFDAIIN